MPKRPHHLRPPRESYAPELLALLQKATSETVVFDARDAGPTDSELWKAELRKFEKLRSALHSLRKTMSDEGDARAPALYRMEASLDRTVGTLTLRPRGAEYAELLARANVSTPELPDEDFLSEPPTSNLGDQK